MSKPVEQYDKFMQLEHIFHSISSAAKAASVTTSRITKAIQNMECLDKHYYKWFYAPEDKDIRPTKDKIAQIDTNDKIINKFKTITEAAKELGLSRNMISKSIHTGEPDKYGYRWIKLNSGVGE